MAGGFLDNKYDGVVLRLPPPQTFMFVVKEIKESDSEWTGCGEAD